MAAALEPGMWVECINAEFRGGVGPYWRMTPPLKLRAIYRIEDILPSALFEDDTVRLALIDIPGCYPDGHRFAYGAPRFRPIYRPRAEFIEALKAPPITAPVRESEGV